MAENLKDLKAENEQLMAIVETKVEGDRLHLDPEFDADALAKLIGVSKERLDRLFRNKSMYRTPEAYIDNLRLLTARTMQRKLMDVLGLTPAEYRALYNRDL